MICIYIPKHFQEQDLTQICAFIKEYSFGILTSVKDCKPIASHLPFVVEQEEKSIRLFGHMAVGNPLWKTFEGQEVLVIFHGPHAYVSPSYYNSKLSVPTWNYIAVHAYGQARIITDNHESRKTLLKMIHKYEPVYEKQWEQLPEEYVQKMLKGIVSFEINVTRFESQFKLSQNKTEDERMLIIQGLKKSGNRTISEIAAWMEKK
ncbi:FMN-binding negative transcriptional regulator [Paenactinomyces guangxiensis]|uniref:FMN-binding negative transcriptional regulator n=1 Tax=Paenactinomyces guangxiensis TaxID=1490290 RepID=A0A7W1WSA9_9BACL|nr:FMN-binding negative transcriptional regulator [Paenactinomyces guangxiensis]MBA4495159.1 FMN-binding negative transcriptional regulator [Paenactinomyces guangxiensis]MBH8592157.1 FMN-binding negative transcriptional regulator [Paenactinomyces guangxiensis]